MRTRRWKKQIAGLMLLAITMTMFLPVYPVQAKENKTEKNDNFSVKMEIGIDGFVTYNMPVVVKVTVESRQNFTGTIRLIPKMDYGQKTAAYGEDISLAAGQAKTFTLVSSTGSSGEMVMELLDEQEKIVYSQSEEISFAGGDSVMVGVLSDDYGALNYFDGIPAVLGNWQGMVNTLELTKDSLPPDSEALSVLNYIIIDNVDTADLSDEQYAALKEWVNCGGVLILSLGGNYQNVLHRFDDDFIAGNVGRMARKDVKWVLPQAEGITGAVLQNQTEDEEELQKETTEEEIEENNGKKEEKAAEEITEKKTEEEKTPGELSLSGVDCIDFVLNGGEKLDGFSDDNTVYRKNAGAGCVVVLSYALGMEPITGWKDRAAVAQLLLYSSAVPATVERIQNGSGYKINEFQRGINVAEIADMNKKPSALLYGLILFFYVIFVGPGLYLLLKAVKKREKIWIAIPLVSLAFTGIIYLTGFGYRVRKPFVNTFSVISLEDGLKSEQVYTSITCPKAKKYTVKIKRDYSGFYCYNSDQYSYSLFDSDSSAGRYDYMIKRQGDGTEIILNNSEAFEDTSFLVKRVTKNEGGMIDCELSCRTDGFEGTITNNTDYDLKGVMVTFENYIYLAGDLKRGEKAVINPAEIIEATGYDTFELMYYERPDLYTNRELFAEYQINTSMGNGFVNTGVYNQGYVWGRIASYRPDIVEGKEVKQSGNGVVFQSYTADYQDVEGSYYPSIEPMMLSNQGNYDPEEGFLYDDEVVVTYSFEGFPGITTLENLCYDQKNSSSEYQKEYAIVYAYNPDTGDYERIFENSAVLSEDALKKYMSGNILMLKYKAKNGAYSDRMPRIAARGNE